MNSKLEYYGSSAAASLGRASDVPRTNPTKFHLPSGPEPNFDIDGSSPVWIMPVAPEIRANLRRRLDNDGAWDWERISQPRIEKLRSGPQALCRRTACSAGFGFVVVQGKLDLIRVGPRC